CSHCSTSSFGPGRSEAASQCLLLGSVMPPDVPGPDADAWQRIYEQELLPRFSAHQRRVKRRFHVFVVIAVASAAFSVWILFAEHSPWWLLLPLILTFSAGLTFVEGFLGFQRRYLDDVMAPWLTYF